MVKKLQQTLAATSLLDLSGQQAALDDPTLALLHAIGTNGSINQAAKSVGLSYKAAWERIEALNNLSPLPLIARQTGGSGGGGTILTEDGRQFLQKALLLQQQLKKLFTFFQENSMEALAMIKTLYGMEMKISARNVWLGNVSNVETGAVNSVVTVRLKGEDTIVSVITENSVQRLGLEPGKEVLTIVKAPSVMLSHEVDPQKISARNILKGTINRIVAGVVNDEVVVDIAGGNTVTSILTSESVRRMKLTQGMPISVVIKASSVLLAIP